jgi:hypothetical protein
VRISQEYPATRRSAVGDRLRSAASSAGLLTLNERTPASRNGRTQTFAHLPAQKWFSEQRRYEVFEQTKELRRTVNTTSGLAVDLIWIFPPG